MTRSERLRLVALGVRVRAARQARGLSIEAVAAVTLIGTGTLSYLERGEREVGVLKLWAVAEALGVSVDVLLDRASWGQGTNASLPVPHGRPEPPFALDPGETAMDRD